MCVHQQDIFSFPDPLKIHKVTTLGFIHLCFFVKFLIRAWIFSGYIPIFQCNIKAMNQSILH